jgi:hypothetical protein
MILGRPMQLPFKKENIKDINNEDRELYHVKGCFCSFECAYTWNYHNEDFGDKWTQQSLLYEIYYMVGNKGNINFAPKKELLIKFGGILDDNEYSRHLKSHSIISNIREIPYVSVEPVIDFRNVKHDKFTGEQKEKCKTKKDIKMFQPLSNKRKYKIFRKKPLFHSINGFFIKKKS